MINKWVDIDSIYPGEEKIKLNSDLCKNLDARRKSKYSADKTLLRDKGIVLNLNEIKELPNGRIRINIDDIRFECFFHRGSKKKLYIVLDGARTSSGGLKREIPVFNRWSYYSFSECSWLSIEDPMYYKYPDLLLGWFYGTREVNYREYVALIAKKIVALLNIPLENVVFFGSSGGGTAAIHSAALYGKCVAVSLNGQINFEYHHNNIEKFKENTGIDLHKGDLYHRNDLCYIMQRNPHTKFILIENCRSNWDYYDHTRYFCKKMDILPSYGISQFRNVFTWIYEAKGDRAHVAFENRNIFFAINFLTELAINGENIERYYNLYLLINEFWYDLYVEKPIVNNPKISMMDNKILGKLDLTETLKNIELLPTGEKYHNFCYKKFRPQTLYKIVIEDVSSSCNIQEFSIGIYDFGNRKFLFKKNYSINQNNYCICFDSGNNIENVGLCIFAGQHGHTNNIDLQIAEIKIFANSYLSDK